MNEVLRDAIVSAGIVGFLAGLPVGLLAQACIARRRRRRQQQLADFFEDVRIGYYRQLGVRPPPRRP